MLPSPLPRVAPAASTYLATRYVSIREMSERLVAPLTPEDLMLQSMPEASPAKWHLAHTTWFFETFLLLPHLPGYRAFHPDFTFLFNSYYNAVGERPLRPNRGLISRPPLEQVRRYREHVDAAMLELINREREELASIIELGLNHEQQHQELIVTDIKHAFWMQPLRPAYAERPADAPSAVAPLDWMAFDGGICDIGHDGRGFAFDNETPRHQVLLQPFTIASRLVTVAEYLDFMGDGGYRRPELWLSEGWETARANDWTAPLYWIEPDGERRVFTAAGIRDLNPAEPVCHLSYFEADAYARWAGRRLPSEFEWEIAAARADAGDSPSRGIFLEAERFHPAPAAKRSLQQMFGDCWEWTASPYVGYPGYRPAEGALGEYNGKFMCNQMVLRGGSCATPRSHIRATYRNFFPPHARWQFSGIRLAQ